MKILLCISSLTKGKGGAERVAAELANEMLSRGHEVYVYSNSTAQEEPSYPLQPGVHHVQMHLFRDTAALRQKIREIGPDVFFIFYATAQLLELYALVADTDIPVGAQECTNPVRAVDNFYKREQVSDMETAFNLRKALLSGMHGIRFTMDSYADFLPSIARPSCMAYNNAFKPAKAKADVRGGGRKRIINVSGLKVANKNGIALIRAFIPLAKEFPDWDVYIYGSNNEPLAKELIAEHGLEGRIVLFGNSEDVYSEYAKAQLHVIASFEEGSPNVVCEAMLHGLPSIGFSDCKGTNELIVSHKNGLLIDRAQELDNLTGALRTLMSDDDLRVRLGQAAYEEACDRFDQKKIYDRWERLFERISSYKGKTGLLYQEQRKINPHLAGYMRRLRTKFITGYTKEQFFPYEAVTNDKIVPPTAVFPKVSFIVKSGERHNTKTIESILSGSYSNQEVLIIEDHDSLDASKYANAHPAIKIISPQSTLSDVVAQTDGEYVIFCRSGVSFNMNEIRKLVESLENHQSDIGLGVTKARTLQDANLNRGCHLTSGKDDPLLKKMDHLPKVYRKTFLTAANLNGVRDESIFEKTSTLIGVPHRVSITPYPVESAA